MAAAGGSRRTRQADVVLAGAVIYTADAVGRFADAVALRDGRIAAVGTRREVTDVAGPATRVVELDGCMVVPGFQDAHVHPLDGGRSEALCNLHERTGIDAYASAIREYARSHPDAEWILGDGWGMDDFPGGNPTRAQLDELVDDRPAFLMNRDGHGAWVNSKALARAGIGRDTPDPPDGRIERDFNGEPTGSLHEGAMRLVEDLAPPVALDDWVEALRVSQRRFHSLGITGWLDARVEPDQLGAYAAMERNGELTGRAVVSLLWDRARGGDQIPELEERREAAETERVRAHTVKIFQDGVAENFTAAMLEPYLDAEGHPTENAGLSMVDPEALKGYVSRLDAAGFQVHFHAIGDRAVREALDAIEAARAANGPRDARHHIAHLQVVAREDVARFKTLGVVVNAQALWGCADRQMRELTLPFLGPERSSRQYPWADFRRAGAILAFGSDWSVSTADPLAQIEVALTRVPPDEPDMPPFLPEQRLDLRTALDAFTIGSAYVSHRDAETGSLEPGKLADIAVLDRDLFADPQHPTDARVVLTLVDGQPVYSDPGVW
jgi:predicted amidohydrolase YtcJ